MKQKFIIAFITALTIIVNGQNTLTLDELIYFQMNKSSIKIDSVLLTKNKWDCNCLREDGRIDLVEEWFYDLNDTTEAVDEKASISKSNIGFGYSAIMTFKTSDKKQFQFILNDILKRKFKEEKIQSFQKDSIEAKVSFYVTENVVIQTIAGEKNGIEGKYVFILIDKKDYLKGLKIN